MEPIPTGSTNWVICKAGRGFDYPDNSVGISYGKAYTTYYVYLPGKGKHFNIPIYQIGHLDVLQTGKGHRHIICNRCFVLKAESEFYLNQTDAQGNRTRRPSCMDCRKGLEGKRPTSEAKRQMQEKKPQTGSLFQCPACQKVGIAGINMKVTLDHDPQTGQPRAWICTLCNIGLGRLKDQADIFDAIQAYLRSFTS